MIFRSFSTKIFVGIFALSTFFLAVSLSFINTMYYRELKKNEIQNNMLASNRIRSQFDLIINLIQATSDYLYNNQEIQDFLAAPPDPDNETRMKITESLHNILEMQPFIANLHLVGIPGICLSTNPSIDEAQLREHYHDYFNVTPDRDMDAEWTSINYQSAIPESSEEMKIISYLKPIPISSQTPAGYLIIDLDYNYIQEMFMVSTIQSNEKTLVINSDGDILFNFPYYTSYEPILKQYPQLLDTSANQTLEGEVFQLDSIIVSEPIKIADWCIIRIVQTQHLIKNAKSITGYAVIIIVISCIASLIYSYWLTRKITRPIKLLSEACNQFKGDDFSFRVNLKSNDEVGNLGRTFNMMLDKLNSYFEHELSEQKRKSSMEFELLQAQINPHFLYNTLDSIRWLAAMQNVTNVAEMTSDLTNLLKYNLKQNTASASLKQELESLRCYIGIQKYRYGDYFEVFYQIPEETLDCLIIPFCIQPIIENSIIHGFADMEREYVIRIESYLQDNKLYIRITDNGSGMDPALLEQLNQANIKSNKFNQIGIKNITERIRMQFGPEYGVFYEQPEQGTTAVIVFPLQTLL